MQMRNRKWLLAVVGVLVITLVGCQGARERKKQISNLEAQLQTCLGEKATLKAELEDTRAELRETEVELEEARSKQAELASLRDSLEQSIEERKQRVQELRELVKNISGMSVESRDEGDFIVIENKILFPSGKITLTDEARKALDASVVGYLKEHLQKNAAQQVRIDGHTDGEPISASGWEDNYHLAAMRAHSVMQHLVSKGIPKQQMYIVGFGPNRPRVEPEKPTASVPENRRVEILMVPERGSTPRQMLESLAK
jgi:chemotaxis protein MotB